LSDKYLTLLIINVIIIVFYILLNVYINIEIEVSSNLNEYIYVYNKFQIKKGGILFLLLNFNIKSVNRIEKRLFSSSNININNRGRNKIRKNRVTNMRRYRFR
jgi:hypothetical protein